VQVYLRVFPIRVTQVRVWFDDLSTCGHTVPTCHTARVYQSRGLLCHISVSSHPFLFISISKISYLCVEESPGSTTAWHLMDVVRCWAFMTDGFGEKGKLYPSELSSVSFHSYLKHIIFMCRIKARIDNRSAFR
jgi:hypothetical protein